MSSKKQRALIVYHNHCIDGFTSAYVCWRGLIEKESFLDEDIDIVPATYGEYDSLISACSQYDYMYVVDFSLPIEVLIAMEDVGKAITVARVIILDHHEGAFDMYSPTLTTGFKGKFEATIHDAKILLDADECGASLVWNHFFPEYHPPELISYVKDYDLWRFKHKDTKAINKYLRLQERTIANWSILADHLNNESLFNLAVVQGEAMLDYHNSLVASAVEKATPISLAGEEGLVVNCSIELASDVGHELAVKGGTYGAVFQQLGNDVKFSLRSKGDYNVNKLAKKLGGGGHKNAAGFMLAAPKEGEMFPDEDSPIGVSIWRI